MQSIVPIWHPDERIKVGQAIKDLYAIQRKPIKEDEIPLFVSRLSEKGIPAKAVIAGLKRLEETEVNPITLRVMVDAAHSMVSVEAPLGVCPYCDSAGSVAMWREVDGESKYETNLGCVCEKGDDFVRRFAAVKWQGALSQYKSNHRGKTISFTLRFPDILERKERKSKSGWEVA